MTGTNGEQALRARLAAEQADLLTYEQAAENLGVGIPTLRKAVNDGKLAYVLPMGITDRNKLGRGQKLMFRVDDLMAWYFPKR